MLNSRFKVLTLLFLFFLMISSCSKDTSNEPENLISGRIRFTNTSYYSIVLNYMTQTRGSQSETRNLGSTVAGGSGPAGRFDLTNIFDGGFIFPGGDQVLVEFQSIAPSNDNPNIPLFRRTVILTVNGTQNVQVKGQNGDYDIGGN
ncbi:MAG: hypothetical protein GY839_00555 [candidate division Zixibacteria bacterium]|nr:hypothetical protein [candidate division Zixibacteria bacterium]